MPILSNVFVLFNHFSLHHLSNSIYYVPQRIILLHCRFIKNISVQHNLTKEMQNKSVLNTEVNKNQFEQRLQRTAGSCAILGQPLRGAHTQLNLE
jgi:hypothetical protein